MQASNGATQSSGACGGQVEEDDEESSSSSLTASSAVEVRISKIVLLRGVLLNTKAPRNFYSTASRVQNLEISRLQRRFTIEIPRN